MPSPQVYSITFPKYPVLRILSSGGVFAVDGEGETEGDLRSISTDDGEIVGQWGVAKEEVFTKIDIFSKC